jgi:hypothetical protein
MDARAATRSASVASRTLMGRSLTRSLTVVMLVRSFLTHLAYLAYLAYLAHPISPRRWRRGSSAF